MRSTSACSFASDTSLLSPPTTNANGTLPDALRARAGKGSLQAGPPVHFDVEQARAPVLPNVEERLPAANAEQSKALARARLSGRHGRKVIHWSDSGVPRPSPRIRPQPPGGVSEVFQGRGSTDSVLDGMDKRGVGGVSPSKRNRLLCDFGG